MKAVMIGAVAALVCVGSVAHANSVNGTDEYRASTLLLPGCEATSGSLPDYCSKPQNSSNRQDEHPNGIGAPHDENQKVNSQ